MSAPCPRAQISTAFENLAESRRFFLGLQRFALYAFPLRGKPHWIFAFGRDGRHVLMHDPAAIRDDQGMAAAAETYAVPWTAFERVTHLGRERLSAAIVIRKGSS